MEAILVFFSKTPIWIYPLLVFLIILGLRAKHAKEISVKQLFILPAAFICWSVFSLIRKIEARPQLLFICISVALLSAFVEFFIARKISLKVHKSKATLVVPGSGYKMLAFLLLIFGVKFVFGFMYGAFPQFTPSVLLVDLGFSGFITGFFLGKNLGLFKTYLAQPADSLEK